MLSEISAVWFYRPSRLWYGLRLIFHFLPKLRNPHSSWWTTGAFWVCRELYQLWASEKQFLKILDTLLYVIWERLGMAYNCVNTVGSFTKLTKLPSIHRALWTGLGCKWDENVIVYDLGFLFSNQRLPIYFSSGDIIIRCYPRCLQVKPFWALLWPTYHSKPHLLSLWNLTVTTWLLPFQGPIIFVTIEEPFSVMAFPTIISELQRTATAELSKDTYSFSDCFGHESIQWTSWENTVKVWETGHTWCIHSYFLSSQTSVLYQECSTN